MPINNMKHSKNKVDLYRQFVSFLTILFGEIIEEFCFSTGWISLWSKFFWIERRMLGGKQTFWGSWLSTRWSSFKNSNQTSKFFCKIKKEADCLKQFIIILRLLMMWNGWDLQILSDRKIPFWYLIGMKDFISSEAAKLIFKLFFLIWWNLFYFRTSLDGWFVPAISAIAESENLLKQVQFIFKW